MLIIGGLFLYMSSSFGPKAIVEVCVEKVSCNDSFVNITWTELEDKPTLKGIFLKCLKSDNIPCEYKYETSSEEWVRIREFIYSKGKHLKIDGVCFEIKFIGAIFAD